MAMKFGNYDDECREVFVEKDELKCSMRKNIELIASFGPLQ